MNYKFPKIEHFKQIKGAIRGRDEFSVQEKDDFIVVLYHVNFIDTFPPVTSENSAIRRELRGIKFSLEDHNPIIARPYHKFFNINERPETMHDQIDWDSKFNILEKLDGSMVHPIMIQDQVVLCTKAGPTDISAPAQIFAESKPTIAYMDFCFDLMESLYTPLFEWCSNQNRIVLSYPDDQLILTAIRHNVTGAYLDLDAMEALAVPYKIPIVKTWPGTFTGINDFVADVQDLEGEEGYVFRWANGHMLKQKNLWYLQLHKTKELLTFEKDIWLLILTNRIDDAKPFMEEPDRIRLETFAEDLLKTIDEKADELKWVVIAAKDNFNKSKKRFAIEIIPTHHRVEKGALFSIWDGDNPRQVIIDILMKQCTSGPRLEEIRPLVNGLRWSDYG